MKQVHKFCHVANFCASWIIWKYGSIFWLNLDSAMRLNCQQFGVQWPQKLGLYGIDRLQLEKIGRFDMRVSVWYFAASRHGWTCLQWMQSWSSGSNHHLRWLTFRPFFFLPKTCIRFGINYIQSGVNMYSWWKHNHHLSTCQVQQPSKDSVPIDITVLIKKAVSFFGVWKNMTWSTSHASVFFPPEFEMQQAPIAAPLAGQPNVAPDALPSPSSGTTNRR